MSTHGDERIAPEIEALQLSDRPDGPGAAAMLAAGIGIFILGLLTTLNEVSTGLHDLLDSFDLDRGVGPLAGKTTLAVIGWALAWIVLGLVWRRKDVSIKGIFWISVALGIAGAVLMFPPVFRSFG